MLVVHALEPDAEREEHADVASLQQSRIQRAFQDLEGDCDKNYGVKTKVSFHAEEILAAGQGTSQS